MILVIAAAISGLGCVAAAAAGLRARGPELTLDTDFSPSVRRTSRATIAAATAAAAVLAAGAAATPRTVSRPVELGTGTTMLVVDLSGSIGQPQYNAIAGAMTSMAKATPNRHVGLVFFSDSAAEVLPPQTPASELERIARFFGADPLSAWLSSGNGTAAPTTNPPSFDDSWVMPSNDPALLPMNLHSNPWVGAFDGGTYIAGGLEAARKALTGAGVKHGEVILFSDLADGAPGRLTEEILRDNRAGLRLKVVPVNASEPDLTTWRRLTGPGSVVKNPAVLGNEQHDRFYGSSGPTQMIPFAALFAVLIGFLVWWRAPLRLKEASS